MIKNLFILLFTGFSTILLGNCQEEIRPNRIGKYEPVFVPLPQNQWVQIGTIVFETPQNLEGQKLILEVKSGEPIAEIQLSAKISKDESVVLAQKSSVQGEFSLEFPKGHSQDWSRVHISVKLDPNHNLKDRLTIKPKGFLDNKELITLTQNREIQSYRVAMPLRDFGDDGVNSYRIPGLVTSTKGTLLAVYDIRRNSSRDLQGDIDVGMSRSTDGGQTWEPMKIIMDMGTWGGLPEDQNGIGDPAILVDHETGHIWVAALWMHGKPGEMAWNSSKPGLSPQETGQFVVVKSEDDGITWSQPIILTDQLKNPEWNLFFNGPGKGITLKDGTLVFPAQYKDKNQMPFSTLIYSKDKGQTWHVGTGARSNTTEAQIVELNDGKLMLNMRDNRGGSRSIAVTSDLGKTWTEHPTSRTALQEPVCMASLIDNPYSSGMLLFSNPATEKGRHNITIKASLNDGSSWPSDMHVLLDEGTGWGYSCLTMINEEEVGILYESSVANITFQIIPLKEILGKQ